VLTSLIVTQMSLGRSVKVASDYLIGTFGGVAYGGALAILIPHDSEWALLMVLALAIAPLAFIASFRANFNVLPVTAIIVLLVPSMQHVSPIASAMDRVLEVTVGGMVGFVVSFLVFPSRAHALTTDAAADTLEQTRRAIERQARNNFHATMGGLTEIEARRQALLSAQTALDATQTGLEVGTRTIVDVLISEQTLFSAQRDYARARNNFIVNGLLLRQAAGTIQASDVSAVNALLVSDAEAALDAPGDDSDIAMPGLPSRPAKATAPAASDSTQPAAKPAKHHHRKKQKAAAAPATDDPSTASPATDAPPVSH